MTRLCSFAYYEAFSCNIGWFAQDEQARHRIARIAIAGMNGVGDPQLLTLARLGFGKLVISNHNESRTQRFA